MLRRLCQTFLPSGNQLYFRYDWGTASEESVLQLTKGQCLAVLKHVPSKKPDYRSRDFVIDRLFMKLFRINNMDTVRQCQQFLKKI